MRGGVQTNNPQQEVPQQSLTQALVLGQRDDFVIDLRFEGAATYLKGFSPQCGPTIQLQPRTRLRAIRRLLDVSTALVALITLLPVFLAVLVTAWFSGDGSPFYRQTRVGRYGRLFGCLKFRSMYPDADERLAELLEHDEAFRQEWTENQKVVNDPRITPIGKFLRKTSLDELPQLINVLKGDMSIVGPRPIVPEETVRYGDAMSTVLSVRPGLTGLWQASGRNSLAYSERVALDVKYVTNQSLPLDALILIKTATSLATGHGAS